MEEAICSRLNPSNHLNLKARTTQSHLWNATCSWRGASSLLMDASEVRAAAVKDVIVLQTEVCSAPREDAAAIFSFL